jgi:hypothetical protein
MPRERVTKVKRELSCVVCRREGKWGGAWQFAVGVVRGNERVALLVSANTYFFE